MVCVDKLAEKTVDVKAKLMNSKNKMEKCNITALNANLLCTGGGTFDNIKNPFMKIKFVDTKCLITWSVLFHLLWKLYSLYAETKNFGE